MCRPWGWTGLWPQHTRLWGLQASASCGAGERGVWVWVAFQGYREQYKVPVANGGDVVEACTAPVCGLRPGCANSTMSCM
jgi:hypothetical protein